MYSYGHYRTRTWVALSGLIPEIIYVMCGARGENSNRLMRALPQLKFVGFEPDIQEHRRLNQQALPGFIYSNAALGARNERGTLYVTRNPVSADLKGSQFSRFRCEPESLPVVAEQTNAAAAVRNKQSRL